MDQKKNISYFVLVALVVSLLIVYFVVRPLLGPLILAAIFAFLFQPLYKRVTRRFEEKPSLAAFITAIIAILLLTIPLGFIMTQVFREAKELYQTLSSGGTDGFIAMIEGTVNHLRALSPVPTDDINLNVGQYVQEGLTSLLHNLGSLFSSFAGIVLSFFVFLISFYYLLKDGGKLVDHFIALSPLDDADDRMILARLSSAASSVVKGNLTIGLIQGFLTGIGFLIFGIPNAILWGCVAAIAALIPGIGTALVLIPAIIFLFAIGNIFGGIGFLIWSFLAVGMIDNFLGPKLMGHGMEMHPLIVFLSVIGGLAFFGPLGFLLGPLAMSLCLALVEIYFALKRREIKESK